MRNDLPKYGLDHDFHSDVIMTSVNINNWRLKKSGVLFDLKTKVGDAENLTDRISKNVIQTFNLFISANSSFCGISLYANVPIKGIPVSFDRGGHTLTSFFL